MSAIYRHFDSWREACRAAGAESGDNGPRNIKPNFSKGREHALGQLREAAARLETTRLSKTQYDAQNPQVRAATVARMFGSWQQALDAAGLLRNENYRDSIPLDDLALDFLRTLRAIGRIPGVRQVVRRSSHGLNSFTRKFGSYVAFKVAAIEYLLGVPALLNDAEVQVLQAHLNNISKKPEAPGEQPSPHHRGRHLGFRAFAFVPTYENEVVSLFSVVAEELGFEIVAQRPAFPDCEARRIIDRARKRFRKCLIEFELRSSDYNRHNHPIHGCDLIVCWEHDWEGCPIQVLELRSEIRRLPGWKLRLSMRDCEAGQMRGCVVRSGHRRVGQVRLGAGLEKVIHRSRCVE
jgi:hypothetical protein